MQFITTVAFQYFVGFKRIMLSLTLNVLCPSKPPCGVVVFGIGYNKRESLVSKDETV